MRLGQVPLTPEKSQSLLLRQTALLQKNRQSGKKTGKKPKGRNYPAPESQERAAGAACQGEQTAPRLAETGHSYPLGTGGRAYCILLLARVSSAMRAEKSVGCKQIYPGGVFLPPNG